ncbi:Uncharacterized protein APZ42_033923 [Daphnia magna]|uniref:SWIM-type domain-containing protein n=1 Tax=Daphnia magna TaxID=35525 RepID=A0A164KLC5_9CRUS|nr:Uncharacterized protein APZ42_033923 [Daphnia magna]
MKLSNGKSVVKGMVTHSMAFSKPPLNCWVVLHSHGGVACGHCDCIGGLGGTCSHVGVLLWGVVNISEETCNSTIQRWHNKSATKHPVSVAFTFYTMKHPHLTESLKVLVMDHRLLKLNVHFPIGTKCYLMLPKKILGFVSVLVQQQMFACELKKAYFCVYTTKDFACIEVPYDETLVTEQMVPKAKLYVLQVALPELLTRYWTAVRYEKKTLLEKVERMFKMVVKRKQV